MSETTPSGSGPPTADRGPDPLPRRGFLKVAGSLAAAGAWIGAAPAVATVRGGADGLRAGSPAAHPLGGGADGALPADLPPLGNGAAPAAQFHAHPGGTGALLEELWSEAGGVPFARPEIEIPPWDGPVPRDPEEIAFLPVHRLAALVRDGRISPVELTELYLERLRRQDPQLLCAVTILEERALREARRAEAELREGRWRGPLHGIPWGVKDLFSTPDGPTAWGAGEFADRVIEEEAEVVRRLAEAGAVLVAKLATGRFALGDRWFRGRTRNPWNPEQGSSGSSAGPASATAAGLVGFAIGTETQGSIVSPARRCGLSALRPTFGRVSRHGGMVLAWSMDKVGPMCRSVEDCALVFHAIHGADPKDPSTLTAPFRFVRRNDLAGIRIGHTEDAPEPFVRALGALGAELRSMPELPGGNSTALRVESAAAFDFHVAARAEEGGREEDPDGDRFRRGRDLLALEHVQSQRERLRLMASLAEAMADVDLVASGSGEVVLTNQTGHPAVVLPWTMSEGEHPQPVCTTLIGHPFRDDLVLAAARAYQESTDWHRQRPALG